MDFIASTLEEDPRLKVGPYSKAFLPMWCESIQSTYQSLTHEPNLPNKLYTFQDPAITEFQNLITQRNILVGHRVY